MVIAANRRVRTAQFCLHGLPPLSLIRQHNTCILRNSEQSTSHYGQGSGQAGRRRHPDCSKACRRPFTGPRPWRSCQRWRSQASARWRQCSWYRWYDATGEMQIVNIARRLLISIAYACAYMSSQHGQRCDIFGIISTDSTHGGSS